MNAGGEKGAKVRPFVRFQAFRRSLGLSCPRAICRESLKLRAETRMDVGRDDGSLNGVEVKASEERR